MDEQGETRRSFFFEILLLPAFSDGKMRRVFHVLFSVVCSIHGRLEIMCFIVFFHGYFVRTVWLYTFALLFPFRVRLSTMPRLINCNFLLDCWLTFFTMISFNFFCTIIFHINYPTQHAAELERMESSSNQMHDFSIHNCPF